MAGQVVWKTEVYRQKGGDAVLEIPVNGGRMSVKDICAEAKIQTVGEGLSLGSLSLRIATETLAERSLLRAERPLRLLIPAAELPRRITAMVLFSPWWTRPVFAEQIPEIPDRTQAAFLDFGDHFGCLIPMVGRRFKSWINGGTESAFCLEMTACLGGIRELEEPLYLYAEGATLQEAVHRAFVWLAGEKGIRLRGERRLPEMFRYLGWCSWDAFYTEVSEEKLRQKAEELREKKVPVRWMLIDDGWFAAKEKMIADFAPDRVKFPEGFRKMTAELRENTAIRWFGVWHALGGYWDGVVPDGELARREAPHLYRAEDGRCVPDPEAGEGFYRDWYELLQREGIDFVKVDGQDAVPQYYENRTSVAEAAGGIMQGMEDAASRMDGAVINCMGMAMENILARPATAISRNSDDFLPAKEESFTEHLMQNAYNAIYHNELYCCDWDMFWTKHTHAEKHALLRAVSGGPVYFSDRIGDTIPEAVRPLVYADGEILMMDRSAMPTADCVFTDPRICGVLKLQNTGKWGQTHRAGGIAVFNLTGNPQVYRLCAAEIPELDEAEEYWVYDYFRRKAFGLKRDEVYTAELREGGYAWFVFLPRTGATACLGLTEKYAGFRAVESAWKGNAGGEAEGSPEIFVLHGSGTAGWLSEKAPARVTVNGADVTDRVRGDENLYTLELPEKAEQTVLMLYGE